MRITIVTTQIHPLHQGPWSLHAAALSAALSASGHELLVVAPLPADCDASSYGLARRLQPFDLVRGNQTIPVTRYEGRLACGAKLTLLAKDTKANDIDASRWFPAAAAQWIHAEADDTAWHLAIGPNSAPAAAWLLSSGLDKVAMILDASQDAGVPSSRDAMSRIRWIAVGTENGLRPEDSAVAAIVNDLTLSSRIRAFPMPSSISAPRQQLSDRGVNKASLQLRLGLPVAETTPLVLFETATSQLATDTLRNALRHGLQVVCTESRPNAALTQLHETYPDRLAFGGESTRSALLASVDAYMAFDDIEKAYESAAHGAVPVVAAAAAGMLTDLSADLSSGSAVLATETEPRGFDAALARLAALSTLSQPLRALQRRLPGYVPTWPRTAAQLAELMVD